MNTEMSDFVKLVIERMDTFPEEFMNQGPNFRWQVLTSGIVDLVTGDPTTSAARSLWALEPHEREALTTKYKAVYLESQKRAFLKNILAGDESKSKKVNVVPRKATPLTAPEITRQALKIMEDEWDKNWSITTMGQNTLLGANTGVASSAMAGYTDPRGLYVNEQTAKVVKRQNEPDNN